MKPSSVHDSLVASLGRVISTFTDGFGHDKHFFQFKSNRSKPLFRLEYDGATIPLYQLVIENNTGCTTGLPLIPKWAGEVSFIAPPSDSRTHLKQVVESRPEIDLAFMVVIEESPTWTSPSSGDTCVQGLRSRPFRLFPDFIPRLPPDGLSPAIVEKSTWIFITRVSFELYLCRPDGSLLVETDLQDDYSAYGTLYPVQGMKKVDALLGDAPGLLRQSLIAEMEESRCDASLVESVRQSQAMLNIPWRSVMLSFRTAVLTAAHERYCSWHMSGQFRQTPQFGIQEMLQ